MKQQGTLAIRRLELNHVCDICGKPRSSGLNTYKHTKCSKLRQAAKAAENGR